MQRYHKNIMNSIEIEVQPVEALACRICLATDTKLYNIREHQLVKAFVDIVGTSPSAWDGLPQHLCSYCRVQLLASADLRARCHRAQNMLKQVRIVNGFVSTEFIRTIDRNNNKLALPLTVTTNDNIIEFVYDENITQIIPNTELYSDDGFCIVEADYASNCSDDDIKPESLKVTTIIKKPDKVKRKRRIGEYFTCEEDYAKFEEQYNFNITRLSEEEQFQEMEDRKKSSNYARALVRCDKCYKGFLSEFTFQNHQKVHDPSVGPHECPLCRTRLRSRPKLRQHMEAHSLKFTCKMCPLVTRYRSMAVMHTEYHSGKTFKCEHCELTFNKRNTYNTHLRIYHPLANASAGACELCGETFLGQLGLRLHRARAHAATNSNPELTCSQCGVRFENQEAFDKHKGDEDTCDPKLSWCEQCGSSFPDENQLDEHQKLSHEYKCHECNKSFATASSLGTHEDRVHRLIKPRKIGFYKYHVYPKKPNSHVEEICEVCGKTFKNSTLMKNHQRTHTGERPFACSECPKKFMTKVALQSHTLTHSGVRNWQCPQCPKTFIHQGSIYQHKRVHTGEKNFKCDICNKSFTQSGSLATHVKYVHMKLKPPPRRRRRDDVTH